VEQLRALGEAEARQAEEALGEAWREQFGDDLAGLYDYVER
jgi:hypothetical protein